MSESGPIVLQTQAQLCVCRCICRSPSSLIASVQQPSMFELADFELMIWWTYKSQYGWFCWVWFTRPSDEHSLQDLCHNIANQHQVRNMLHQVNGQDPAC